MASLYQSLKTYIKRFLSCIVLEWVELTDVGISEWACGGGRQVITSWSHSRPTGQGVTLIQWIQYINLILMRATNTPLRGI